jgi:hypothetical protein
MSEINHITGRQLAAARALLGIGQVELATRANISAPTLRRMEANGGPLTGMTNNISAVVSALIDAGIVFIPENGGGVGVRMKFNRREVKAIDVLENEGGAVGEDDV